MNLISRGAEAILFKDKWENLEILVKKRIKKGYRTSELDKKLRKTRTKREVKLLSTSRRVGVPTPQVFEINEDKGIIKMELLEGEKIKNLIPNLSEKDSTKIFKKIGEQIGKIHKRGIIHGDLTTSNMILKEDKIYFIDFSLGLFTKSIEDQAVDLYLLYEVLNSTHSSKSEILWESVIEGYKEKFSNSKKVLKRFDEIKKRRRYVS